jgi:hypothetical protein
LGLPADLPDTMIKGLLNFQNGFQYNNADGANAGSFIG